MRVTNDPVPKIRTAGHTILGVRERENADFNIRPDAHLPSDEPTTPTNLMKYRKAHVNEPGKIQMHWGQADDEPRFPKTYSYGKPTYNSEHVGDVMKAQNQTGLGDKFNDIKEDQYASHVREPLGQGFSRKYEWPDKAQNGSIVFGCPTAGLESAKEMIFPAGGAHINEDAETHAIYRKTHGNFAPGEQRTRDYNWKFGPEDHVFGYAEKKVLNGAAQALHNERVEEHFPKTTIVKKTIEDHKAVGGDLLGKSKNLGQGQSDRGDDFVHGIRNLQGGDTWNAARCIHGQPTEKELLPDHDLGKSVKPNCRNVVRNEDDKLRSFGVPTIRKDIPFKDFKSVADYQVSIKQSTLTNDPIFV